ncbi:hypothetical protein T484DRAFT_1952047, partial [Baffinella frigidus]
FSSADAAVGAVGAIGHPAFSQPGEAFSDNRQDLSIQIGGPRTSRPQEPRRSQSFLGQPPRSVDSRQPPTQPPSEAWGLDNV